MARPAGRNHPAVRRLRALRRDGSRRLAEGVFVAEGLHLAEEALACEAPVDLVLISSRLAKTPDGPELLDSIRRRGLECLETSDAVLDSVQDTRSPQPIVMLVRRTDWSPDALLGRGRHVPLIAVAHALQDPGNLGGVMRTADAAGATGLVVCGDSADLFHPRAVRASMGSIFRLPALACGLQALVEQLHDRRIVTLAADAAEGTAFDHCDFTRPCALFLGAEGCGLPRRLIAELDERVHVPMRPGVESLSVGAAAAVLLFEAARQRAAGC